MNNDAHGFWFKDFVSHNKKAFESVSKEKPSEKKKKATEDDGVGRIPLPDTYVPQASSHLTMVNETKMVEDNLERQAKANDIIAVKHGEEKETRVPVNKLIANLRKHFYDDRKLPRDRYGRYKQGRLVLENLSEYEMDRVDIYDFVLVVFEMKDQHGKKVEKFYLAQIFRFGDRTTRSNTKQLTRQSIPEIISRKGNIEYRYFEEVPRSQKEEMDGNIIFSGNTLHAASHLPSGLEKENTQCLVCRVLVDRIPSGDSNVELLSLSRQNFNAAVELYEERKVAIAQAVQEARQDREELQSEKPDGFERETVERGHGKRKATKPVLGNKPLRNKKQKKP